MVLEIENGRLDLAVIRANETMMRAAAVFAGRAV